MKPVTTQAARLVGAGRVEIEDATVADPGDGEVLIAVRAVGLCGSDAHWYSEGGIGDTGLDGPLILGNEFCGIIESGLRAGERVAVDPSIPCLSCEQCLANRHNLCVAMRFAGHGSTHGALRGHLVWPERCLVPIPDDMPDVVGAMLEPLGVAIHAIDLAAVEPTTKVAIVGCGPIGLLLILALQATGPTDVVAVEPLDHRREAARRLGAMVERNVGIRDSDVVFETSGTNEGLHTALSQARPGGRIVVVGIPTDDTTTITASLARRKELTFVWCRRMDSGDLARAAVLARDRATEIGALVSHRFALSDTAAAFEVLAGRLGLKVMVTPGVGAADRDG